MKKRISGEMRESIRNRAGDRCEYCGIRTSATPYPYHVDHIIPPMHGGEENAENLAWSCFQCNSAKSAIIASYDADTGALTPLFHPRQQIWREHFQMSDGMVQGLTAVGRVTVRMLQMNDDARIETRQRLVRRGEW